MGLPNETCLLIMLEPMWEKNDRMANNQERAVSILRKFYMKGRSCASELTRTLGWTKCVNSHAVATLDWVVLWSWACLVYGETSGSNGSLNTWSKWHQPIDDSLKYPLDTSKCPYGWHRWGENYSRLRNLECAKLAPQSNPLALWQVENSLH